MTKKRFLYIFLALVISFILLFLIKYKLDFQKRIIKKEILATKEAVKNKDINGTVRYLSSNFTYEGLDRESIKEALNSFFEEFDKIKINLSKIKIKIEGDKAMVNFRLTVLVTYQGMTGSVIGGIAGPARAECIFIKNEEWLLENLTIFKGKK